jgi:hypothetical protein
MKHSLNSPERMHRDAKAEKPNYRAFGSRLIGRMETH